MRRVNPLPGSGQGLPDPQKGLLRGAMVQEEPPGGRLKGLGLPPEAVPPGEFLLVEVHPSPQALKKAPQAVVVGVVVGEEKGPHVGEAKPQLGQVEL